MTIEIPDNLAQLAADGATFIVTPEAEEALIALNKAEKEVEAALKFMKEAIRQQVEETDPTLKSIKGSRVSLSIQPTGAKYAIDPEQIDKVSEVFYETKTTYSVNSDILEKYMKEHDMDYLPEGINHPERGTKIVLTIKKGTE